MKTIVKLVALSVAVLALGTAAPARGATGDPLFVFVPFPPPPPSEPTPPPTGRFNGPCGLAVNSAGTFYVADYYHRLIHSFSPLPPTQHFYLGSRAGGDSLDGACGMAFDSSNSLYVNTFHRDVMGEAIFGPEQPTGVAIDTSDDHLYVDHRTYIAAYDSTGMPVLDAGLPLKVGFGSLEDGYGLAVSGFAATAGRIYVPDAGTNTVKVYDPAAVDKEDPVVTLAPPSGHFSSLRDAAIAIDRVTGNVYVVDNLQPRYTEEPEAAIDVFSPAGSYLGRLKYRIVDALPAGLAVDNSTGPTQGRVYVTSGNTNEAGIYAYPPGSEVASALPATVSVGVTASGLGNGAIISDLGELDCTGSCEAQVRAGADVILSASPDPGSVFAGWSGGGCSGSSDCKVTMDEATSVSAVFDPPTAPVAGHGGPPPREEADPVSPSALSHRIRRHHRAKHHRHSQRHRKGSPR